MSKQIALDEALDIAEQLEPDEQAELVSILRRRIAERGRQELVAQVEEARGEFAAGRCKPMTPEEIIAEAKS